MEMEMDDRNGLDTTPQQLAETVRRRINVSGPSRRNLEGIIPRFGQ
jgi:hypothetical protein